LLAEDWVNYTVEMTEGDTVILHVRNFDGLMDEDVKAAAGGGFARDFFCEGDVGNVTW
jgi:hypothetical protein